MAWQQPPPQPWPSWAPWPAWAWLTFPLAGSDALGPGLQMFDKFEEGSGTARKQSPDMAQGLRSEPRRPVYCEADQYMSDLPEVCILADAPVRSSQQQSWLEALDLCAHRALVLQLLPPPCIATGWQVQSRGVLSRRLRARMLP